MTRFTLRRTRAGVTLIELIVTTGMIALLALAVGTAFVAGLDTERRQVRRRNEQDQITAMEQRITQMLQGAKLDSNQQDRVTYFIGDEAGDTISPVGVNGSTPGGQNAPTLSNNDNSDSEAATDLGCSRLTFTTIALDIPMRARTNPDDFETQQKRYGPVGGVAEVQWATTPAGDAGDRQGLFERLQRPSDGDPSQGGMESMLEGQVKQIGFQFWDGTAWVTSWNTVNGLQKRLPAAVLVSYILNNDQQGITHQFTVPIPTSDVTELNPMQQSASSQ